MRQLESVDEPAACHAAMLHTYEATSRERHSGALPGGFIASKRDCRRNYGYSRSKTSYTTCVSDTNDTEHAIKAINKATGFRSQLRRTSPFRPRSKALACSGKSLVASDMSPFLQQGRNARLLAPGTWVGLQARRHALRHMLTWALAAVNAAIRAGRCICAAQFADRCFNQFIIASRSGC